MLDAAAAGGSGGGKGQFRRTGGKPFDLLQLDAVPGGVADDGVEAADGIVVLPVAPDAGEGDLPMEKVFAVGDAAGGVPQFDECGPEGALADGVGRVDAFRAVGQEFKGALGTEGDDADERLFEDGASLLFEAGAKPMHAAECVEQAAQWGGRFLDFAKELG